MTQNKTKLILDVDTGIDDALAIIYAVKSNEAIVEGITTGFGNAVVEQTTENTLKILDLSQPTYDIPVAMGAEKPLVRPRRAPSVDIHGRDGLGEYPLPETNRRVIEQNAVDFIIQTIHHNPNEITLVFTGRLTNLAHALVKDPSIVDKVKNLVLMGGAIHVPGNITEIAEANIHGDPEAAHRVFESGIPITMVGLDVTSQTKFGEKHFTQLMEKMSEKQQDLKDFFYNVFKFSFDASDKMNEGRFRMMHDPLAVGVAINAEYITTEDLYVYVETQGDLSSGATLIDARHPQSITNASVGIEVNDEDFLQQYIDTVTN